MAPHSGTLAWKIPWTEEPGGLQSMRSWLSDFTSTFPFHALEKEMATHSSVLAWRIPGMGEPGGRPSMGLHRVGHDWSDLAAAAAAAERTKSNKIARVQLTWKPMSTLRLVFGTISWNSPWGFQVILGFFEPHFEPHFWNLKSEKNTELDLVLSLSDFITDILLVQIYEFY